MDVEFAHPVERELARLFDEHGIAWEYEPHTFVLEWDESGAVREAFTPDFFLPDLGVYVECTVMRQALTTSKRRKVRRTRECTGAVVEVMFKRDFERLASRWDIPSLSRATRPDADVSTPADPGMEMPHMTRGARTVDEHASIRVDVDNANDASVVAVGGDVDLHAAPELRDSLNRLTDADARKIVVDLSEATFLDSMALGVLLAAKKSIDAQGKRLAIVASTPEVRRIFEITMLDRVFELHATRAEALDAAGAGFGA